MDAVGGGENFSIEDVVREPSLSYANYVVEGGENIGFE